LSDPGFFGDSDLSGFYDDSLAENPLGLEIEQRTSLFESEDMSNCVIIEYNVFSHAALPEETLYLGFLIDWDMGFEGSGIEKAGYNSAGKFSYFYNQDQHLYVGVRFLNRELLSHRLFANVPGSKTLLTDAQKYEYLASGVIAAGVDKWGDYYRLISTALPISSSSDTLTTALAVVVAGSLAELEMSFLKAFDFYNITTDVDDHGGDPILPNAMALMQNYPNPFNMATTISFNLASPGQVRIEVFNLLGQRIATVAEGSYPSGLSAIVWNGRNDSGEELSSGIYFYRLTIDGARAESRKLVILK